MNTTVDFFFNKASKWQESFQQLRKIVLACGLTEELKWGKPCYTSDGNNVVLIHGFKDYCALLFHKGVLMKDPKKILIQQTENVQAARQIRFSNVEQIIKMKSVLKAYVKEATTIEKSGVKVKLKKTAEYAIPTEFDEALKDVVLKKAFYTLSPGRQRGYLLYFSSAKQSKTREARIEKYAAKILAGKGLED